jgi:hypothetical protein
MVERKERNKRETEQFKQPTRLAQKLKELYPEICKQTEQEREQLREDVEEREEIVDEMDIETFLEEYGCNLEHVEEIKDDLVVVTIDSHFYHEADQLPDGYGYSGGAARALLLRSLGIDNQAEPRDVDVIRFADEEPEVGQDRELARKHMPKDFEDGHGVRKVDENYFETRDLTVNQVYACDDQAEIVATKQAVKDNVRHILRVTDYEKEQYGGLGPKMLSKMIRFYVERANKYGEAKIDDLDEQKMEKLRGEGSKRQYYINPFWLAVQLDRAYEVDKEYAQKFTKELKKINQLPDRLQNLDEVTDYLSDLIVSFCFRSIDKEEIDSKNFELEEEWKQYESISTQEGMDNRSQDL